MHEIMRNARGWEERKANDSNRERDNQDQDFLFYSQKEPVPRQQLVKTYIRKVEEEKKKKKIWQFQSILEHRLIEALATLHVTLKRHLTRLSKGWCRCRSHGSLISWFLNFLGETFFKVWYWRKDEWVMGSVCSVLFYPSLTFESLLQNFSIWKNSH